MKCTVPIRLYPTPSQSQSIRRTMQAYNQFADEVASMASVTGEWLPQRLLEKIYYRPLREGETYSLANPYNLSPDLVQSAIYKVCNARKEAPSEVLRFRPYSPMPFREGMVSWDQQNLLQIHTIEGPISVKASLEPLEEAGPGLQIGQSWFERRRGRFHVMAVTDDQGPLPFGFTRRVTPLVGENRIWPFRSESQAPTAPQVQLPSLDGKWAKVS